MDQIEDAVIIEDVPAQPQFDAEEHINMLFNKTIQSGEFVESLAFRVLSLAAVAIRDRIQQSTNRVPKIMLAREYSAGAHKFELTDTSVVLWAKDEDGEWVDYPIPEDAAAAIRTIVIADGFTQGETGYMNNDIRIQAELNALQGAINAETGALEL